MKALLIAAVVSSSGCSAAPTTADKPSGWTCPGSCGSNCLCDQFSKCQAGACDADKKRPPFPPPAVDEYAKCCAAVAGGRTVTLAVGIDGGDYRVDSLSGFAAGLYRCWRQDGKNLMEPVGVKREVPEAFQPSCPGGVCPAPSASMSRFGGINLRNKGRGVW